MGQCRRYTMARQVKWPGWKIHCPGSSPGSALPSPAYCFASVIVWTENKNVAISDRFICFILTVKRRWRPVFRGRQLKKGRQLFWGKSASGWPDWRILWPRNELAPLLRWRRHWIGVKRPSPLYLRTLWRYTNAVIIIIIKVTPFWYDGVRIARVQMNYT